MGGRLVTQFPLLPDSEEIIAAVDLLKRLAHPGRLAIVKHLMSGERSVSDLEQDLGLNQPSLSQQLTELRKAGIVATRRHAKNVYYRIADERAERLVDHLMGQASRRVGTTASRPARSPLSAAVFAKVRRPAANDDADDEAIKQSPN